MTFFFYGTLRPEMAPRDLAPHVSRGRSVAKGVVRGQVFAFPNFPAAIPDPGSGSRIRGEVFEFPDDHTLLIALDAYEEYDPANPRDSLFIRRMVPVELDDGRNLSCWAYVYNRGLEGSSPVPSGDYARWKALAKT